MSGLTDINIFMRTSDEPGLWRACSAAYASACCVTHLMNPQIEQLKIR
jgi:hypothetical protein